MAIEDDLKKIAELQDKFKADHGTYFEMDWSAQKIEIPIEGDTLALTKIKRFIPSGVASLTDSAFPSKEVTDVAFVPTATDWRFCVGRGLKRDRQGGLASECWYCTATQKSRDGIVTHRIISGGDPEMLKADGLIE
jgi:hypothetical protein